MTNEYNKAMAEKYAKINAKLKPCPFCGVVAKMWQDPMGHARQKIECGKCGIGTLWQRNQRALVRKWNKRVELKEETESCEIIEISLDCKNYKLKPCPFCGGEAKMWQDMYLTALKKVECSGCGARTFWEVFNENLLAENWNKL
jgi:Lar family restriction alleviation protein